MENSLTQYMPMFSALGDDLPPRSNDLLARVHNVFKGRNQDRMMWALKWLRAYFVMGGNGYTSDMSDDLRSRLVARIQRDFPQSRDIRNDSIDFFNSITPMAHYFQMPIAEIQNYRFGNKTPSQAINDLTSFEQDFKQAASQEVTLRGDEAVVLDFRDGYVWMNLNRGGCSDEAGAMGHCGNGAGSDGETILSLRKLVRPNVYRPVLTFILDGNGNLGEMKGRGNDKPAARYHRYITALLRSDIVQGIKGGGYLPQNNFSLSDLTADEADALIQLKPALMGPEDCYDRYRDAMKHGNTDRAAYFREQLADFLSDMHDIDWDNDEITILEPKSFLEYAQDLGFRGYEDADDLAFALETDLELSQQLAEDVAAHFEEEFSLVRSEFMSMVNFNNYHVRFDRKMEGSTEKWAPVIGLREFFLGDYDGDDIELDAGRLTEIDSHTRDYMRAKVEDKSVANECPLLSIFISGDRTTYDEYGQKMATTKVKLEQVMKLYYKETQSSDHRDQLRFDLSK